MLGNHAAGENIASYCTKCRLNLDHTVVAVVDAVIVKVRCRTCGSTHKFRDPSSPPKAKSPRAKGAVTAQLPKAAAWEVAMSSAKGQERDYAMSAKFKVGDIIIHERFGKGVVTKLYAAKCDVLFQDKERLMASAN